MKNLMCYVMMFGLLGMMFGSAAAEDLQFPKTEEEIVDALRAPVKTKGALSKQNADDGQALFDEKKPAMKTKGISKVADDENASDSEPQKVGALILFDTGSDAIKTESFDLLREYGKAFTGDLQDAVVLVVGHTDGDGTEEYNLMLSQKRAEAVKQFLVKEFDIDEKRLIVKPFGESKPLEANDTPEGKAKNRRVEFARIQ